MQGNSLAAQHLNEKPGRLHTPVHNIKMNWHDYYIFNKKLSYDHQYKKYDVPALQNGGAKHFNQLRA
jgi:hypothetical protein